MKKIILSLLLSFVFSACSIMSITPSKTVTLEVKKLKNWESEDFNKSLSSFIKNCKSNKAHKLYVSGSLDLCKEALFYKDDAKAFFETHFYAKKLNSDGLLTGYYEPYLNGSLYKSDTYKYPIFEKPKDMFTIDLSKSYPELKGKRFRGRIVKDKVISYYDREYLENNEVNASIICYVDNKIDLFFLQIQGSGRIILENNNSTLFVGYSDQNGYKYRAIGRYMIQKNYLTKEEVSLQTIRAFLDNHPDKVDEILNYNQSYVFFKKREQGATGSLGVELTPFKSVAVDRKYHKLGSLLYIDAKVDKKDFNSIVIAQDTGGAINGDVRTDLFTGYTQEGKRIAGELKSPLKLYELVPKF